MESNVFNAVISACEKAVNWEMASGILTRMCDDALRPDVVTCNSVLSASENGVRWENIINIFQRMDRCQLQPDSVSYCAAATALGEVGFWALAIEVFNDARRLKLINTFLLTSSVSACAGAALWTLALTLHGEGDLLALPNARPSQESYNAAIFACQQAGKWAWSLELLCQMQAQRIHLHAISLECAARACGHSNQWKNAVGLLDFGCHTGGGDPAMWSTVVWAVETAQVAP